MKRTLLFLCVAGTAWAIPSGQKWPPNAIPVPYKLFQHASINCPCDFASQVQPAVLSGFARWTNAQVACTSWNSSFQGNYSSPTGRNAINGTDAQNLLIWLSGSDWIQPSAVLGLTTTSYDPGTGIISDADIEFNNNVTWKVGGTAQTVDVESIATHEGGHFLGLAHTPSTAAVMYATYTIGDIKRDLDPGTDIQDVCTVYPSAGGGAGAQGAACTSDTNCGTSAPVCRGPVGTTGGICTQTCTSSTTCPTGYQCIASNNGNACLVPAGSPDLCKYCANGNACSNGNCVGDGRHNWCTITCSTAADCGSGYQCVTESGTTISVCEPNTAANGQLQCPTPQCAQNSDCPVGYACNANGMCEATGATGDRCEVSLYCQSCNACVGTSTEAYCLACCGGQSGGAICNTCTPSSCSGGTCDALANNTGDAVCVPGGAGTCQPCDANTPCQSGLSCVAGACHPPCNFSNPGNCGACGQTSGGQGICACPGEVAGEGQPCGQTSSSTIAICQTGLVCIGGASLGTCRASCPTGVCGSGEVCTPVSGGGQVCMPGTTAGQACNTCTTGSCASGLTCANGRCYPPCNPASPSCQTCVDMGGGNGVCACPDETAGVGQPCGVISGAPRACGPGLACGSDQACHIVCDPSAPQCPGGTVCTKSGSSSFCLPGGADGGADGGTGGGNGGCGCTTLPASAVWPLLALAGVALRRRRR